MITDRGRAPVRVGLGVVALVALLLALPSEATMGDMIRVIYLHGALVRAAEVAIAIAAGLGAIYLLANRPGLSRWSSALQRTAFLFWLLSFLISLLIMREAWGGINWTEPRFVASSRVLVAAAIAIALGLMLESPRVAALAGIGLALLVAVGAAPSGPALHPANPIGSSPSLLLQVEYYAVVLLSLGLAWESARWLLPSAHSPVPSGVEGGEAR